MKNDFQIGQRLTLITINSLAITEKLQIEIVNYNGVCFTFRPRNANQKTLYRLELSNKDLLFDGWDFPFLVDYETNYFRGNACLNFLTNEPQKLKEYIERFNLNDKFTRKGIIIYIDEKNEENVLYPFENVRHAVINRIKERTLN